MTIAEQPDVELERGEGWTQGWPESSVIIPMPKEPFLDCLDEPWTLRQLDGTVSGLTFRGVMLHTVRQAQVDNAGQAMQVLALVETIKEAGDEIALVEQDYRTLISLLRRTAHHVWTAPDSAFLLRYISMESFMVGGRIK